MGYPAEVRLEVYDAVIEYASSGTLLELKPMAKMAFSFIKREIDLENQRCADINSKRSQAGKAGMSKRYQDVTNDNKTNKCYQVLTNVTSDNKTNKCYQMLSNDLRERDIDNNILTNNIDNNIIILDKNNNNSLSPLPSPSLNAQCDKKRDKKRDAECEAEFEQFWNAYNKKVDRKRCFAKFKKLSKSDKEKIFQTLLVYVASTPDVKFRKNPLTYLNNEAWNNEIIYRNGAQQTQSTANRQSADLSKFRDSSRVYSDESDF